MAFQGGEPLLYNDFYDVICFAASKIPFINLTTNGTLLTEEMVASLSRHLTSMTVSIDKISTADQALGIKVTQSPDLFIKLSEWQRRYGLFIQINIVMSKANHMDLLEYADLLNKYDLGLIIIPIHSSDGQWYFRSNTPQLEFTSDNYLEFDSIINELIRRKQRGHRILNTKYHLEMMKNWIRGSKWICDAGKYYFDVNPDGRISVCEDMYPLAISLLKPLARNYYQQLMDNGGHSQIQKCINSQPCIIDAYYPISHILKRPFTLLKEYSYIRRLFNRADYFDANI